MASEFFQRITAKTAESAESGYDGAGFISGEITIETPPVKLSNTEEDEYEWIVRSTPSGFAEQIHFDEWSSEELASGAVYTTDIESREPEENSHTWHGRLARGLESCPATAQESFTAEWTAPDLTPPANFSDVEERDAEEHPPLPVSGEVEFAAEWSAPDLTPPVNLSDIEEREAEEHALLSISAEEAVEDELSELTLSPQPVSFSDVEETASLSASEPEELIDELSELTLASQPTDVSETPSEPEESAAPSGIEDTLAHIGPSPQPPGSLSIQYPVVHLLKDPPEIWDQVPEQPAEFHPAVTFLARVAANNQKLVLTTLGVMLLCGVCTFGILKLWQADRGNAEMVQAQPEHRIEVPQPTVAPTAPTETGPATQKSAASSIDSSDKSSAASVDSSSRDAANKNTGKPTDSDRTANTSTETTNNTANVAKNSGKGNALAATAHASNKAKSAPTSVARSTSRNTTRRTAPSVARSTTTSRNSSATSRNTTTPSNSSPSTARKPEPARVITVGNGETRPRLVTPRTSVTKNFRG